MRLTCREARQVFLYNPETGELFWKNRGRKRTLDKPVGHASRLTGSNGEGYRRVWFDGYKYLVHRIIWLMVTGDWPRNQIDHIDGDRRNNRFENLRDVTPAENTAAYWSRADANLGH